MHRTFISTVIAAALAITGVSSTMAQAGEYRRAPVPQHRSNGGNEAVAAALAGVAALFILGKTMERNNSRRETIIVPAPAPKHVHRHKQPHVQKHNRGHGNKRHAHGSPRHNGRVLNHWHTHRSGTRHRHPHKGVHHPRGW